MLIDAGDVTPGSCLTADVCIVGAGPAGISISLALRGSGLSVILLESGGLLPSVRAQRLNRGDVVGHDYFRLDGCRFRAFGGTTHRWGGWSRPLDDLDFVQRDWVADSGWPIGGSDLQPYNGRAAELLELSTARFDLDHWLGVLPKPFGFDAASSFESNVFQYSPQTNFGTRYHEEIAGDRATRAILNATVVELPLAAASQRIDRLEVRSFGGNAFSVRSKVVVIAAGGLENARLLLAARTDRPAGLGNEHDNVGRYFMEHLHTPAGHLLAAPSVAGSDSATFYWRATRDGVRTRGVLTPTDTAQRESRLATCSIAIEEESYGFGTPFVGWHPRLTIPAARLIQAAAGTPAAGLTRRLQEKAELAYNRQKRFLTGRAARQTRRRTPRAAEQRLYSLYFRTEQHPNRASRVRLGTDRDEFGVPRLELDWRVTEADLELVPAWLDRLDEDVRAAGVGEILRPPAGWQRQVIGGPHHIGTTRMSQDPRSGVVDRNCKVHSLANLYVAGSSVFATGGYANPTFTLVSLALRLADHLRTELA